jgi:hypothetical protein
VYILVPSEGQDILRGFRISSKRLSGFLKKIKSVHKWNPKFFSAKWTQYIVDRTVFRISAFHVSMEIAVVRISSKYSQNRERHKWSLGKNSLYDLSTSEIFYLIFYCRSLIIKLIWRFKQTNFSFFLTTFRPRYSTFYAMSYTAIKGRKLHTYKILSRVGRVHVTKIMGSRSDHWIY